MMYEWLLIIILRSPQGGVAVTTEKLADKASCEAVSYSFTAPEYMVKCIPITRGVGR